MNADLIVNDTQIKVIQHSKTATSATGRWIAMAENCASITRLGIYQIDESKFIIRFN